MGFLVERPLDEKTARLTPEVFARRSDPSSSAYSTSLFPKSSVDSVENSTESRSEIVNVFPLKKEYDKFVANPNFSCEQGSPVLPTESTFTTLISLLTLW